MPNGWGLSNMITHGTRVMTTNGWLSPEQLTYLGSAQRPKLVCPFSGGLNDFQIDHAGYAPYWTYTLTTPFGDLSGRVWTFKAPRPCKMPLANSITWDMRKKDFIQAAHSDCGFDGVAWAQGFMLRHGVHYKHTLDPEKYKMFTKRLESIISCNPEPWGTTAIPDESSTCLVKGAFIKGFLAADGTGGVFKTSNEAFFRFLVANHGFAGLVLTGKEAKQVQRLTATKGDVRYNQYSITLSKGVSFKGFKVYDIDGPSEALTQVYQIKIPGDGRYCVEGGWTVFSD